MKIYSRIFILEEDITCGWTVQDVEVVNGSSSLCLCINILFVWLANNDANLRMARGL